MALLTPLLDLVAQTAGLISSCIIRALMEGFCSRYLLDTR